MTINDITKAAEVFGDARFIEWLRFVMKWECVYKNGQIVSENDPSDAGGLTFAGIDRRSHPEFPYSNPTAAAVAKIYWFDYWVKARAAEMAFPVGEVIANFAVNMGLFRAATLLQTAINQIPGGGETKVDGGIGPKTLAAVKLEQPEKLADIIEDQADKFYRGIVTARPSQKKFLQGWLNRNDALEQWWMKLPVPN